MAPRFKHDLVGSTTFKPSTDCGNDDICSITCAAQLGESVAGVWLWWGFEAGPDFVVIDLAAQQDRSHASTYVVGMMVDLQ